MSLLDADIHSAHPSVIIDADAMFSEDISYFGYPSFRRSSLSRLGSSRGNFLPPPARCVCAGLPASSCTSPLLSTPSQAALLYDITDLVFQCS